MNAFLARVPRVIAAVVCITFFQSQAATHTVKFRSNVFDPAALTVNAGDTVIFEREGGFHTVTGTGSDPFCGNNSVDTSCSVTFNTPGTFPYQCLFHAGIGMIGSVTVVGVAEKPNVVPFHINGWTSSVVVSRAPGNNISDPDFYDDREIFLDWAIANTSLTAGITPRFFTEVLVDGVSKASWFHDGLAPDTFNKIEDYNLGTLPVGEHKLTLVADHTGVVDESNEADNTFEVNVRVIPSITHKHTVLVSDFEFSPASLTIQKGDTVDFRVIGGTHTATGTGSDPFCGDNAIPQVCTVTFDQAGLFPYRCRFHSTDGVNPSGMIGQIRVIDTILVESAPAINSPFAVAPNAAVDYPTGTVTIPLPASRTFWRLNSSTALRVTSVKATTTSIVLNFD